MILFKQRLILSSIKKFFVLIFKGIYAVLEFLNLHLALLVSVLGFILFLTGAYTGSKVVRIVLWSLMGIALLYAVIATFYKIFKRKTPKDNGKTANETVVDTVNEPVTPIENINDQPINEQIKQHKAPYTFYAVKGKPDYYFAEFSDRYELFYKSPNGLVRIRTDYKKKW